MTGALDGLKVLDFARFLPGLYFGWLAGDMGADVVLVEQPGAGKGSATDRARPTYRRNRRSISIDLRNPQARSVVETLARDADVLVEDFRPGTMARHGLHYEHLALINPRLIYCSVSFAGQSGPYANRAGHDPAALAVAGALGRLSGGPVPVLPGVQVADALAGAHAALGVFAALEARRRTGRGQHVDVAMTDASLALLMVELGRHADLATLPPPNHAWHPKGGVWRCADGTYLCTTDMEPRYWRRFCAAMGLDEFADAQHDRKRHPEMHDRIAARFLEHPRAHWLEILVAADTQVMPVLTPAEAMADSHHRARGMVEEIAVDGSTLVQIGTPFRLSDTPADRRVPIAAKDADRDAILAETGLSPDAVAELAAAGVFGSPES